MEQFWLAIFAWATVHWSWLLTALWLCAAHGCALGIMRSPPVEKDFPIYFLHVCLSCVLFPFATVVQLYIKLFTSK